nr:helix-turn-helix transcriptional regulator [Brevundimonas diminuta]
MSGSCPHSAPAEALDALSLRQWECLQLAATGLSSAGIAARLGVSPRTVDEHLSRACRALDVRTRVQAAALLARFDALETGPAVLRTCPQPPSHPEGQASCSI